MRLGEVAVGGKQKDCAGKGFVKGDPMLEVGALAAQTRKCRGK